MTILSRMTHVKQQQQKVLYGRANMKWRADNLNGHCYSELEDDNIRSKRRNHRIRNCNDLLLSFPRHRAKAARGKITRKSPE